MEEVKVEQVQEVEQVKVEATPQVDIAPINEALTKLQEENKFMKEEIIRLKNVGVNANPQIEEKAYEIHKEIWKEHF